MAYDSSNIFAKILRREIPSTAVYEDDAVLAINDIAPSAPMHVLVIPKGEYESFDDFVRNADDATVAHFFKVVQKIAADHGVDQSGYRLISNHGEDGGQTVPHFHVHILGKKPLGGLFG